MAQCLVGFGSNVGEREENLTRALQFVAAQPDIQVTRQSRHYETQPAGGPANQPPFLNAAFRCMTSLSPYAMLSCLQEVERQLGRVRVQRWGPRTADLDLLLYDGVQLDTAQLVLPHARMAFRRFVLVPAAEVAADMVHPPTGWTVAELLARLDVTPPYVALVGGSGVQRRELAQRAAGRLGCRHVADVSLAAPAAPPSGDPLRAAGDKQRQLAVLAQRAERLREVLALPRPGSREDFAISDFGCIESLAVARLSLALPDRLELEAACRAISRDLVFPRLLVLCSENSSGEPDRRQSGYHKELERLVQQPQQCPVLKVPSDDWGWCVEEIVAAVEGMLR